ncbi:MAG: hypothetical protein ABWY06_11290 [Pseudomonas sp.]|uniref:hypothetical protein n=1 Tax=Pseudomonas sp. TaxID=306 RepID=UPI0033909003
MARYPAVLSLVLTSLLSGCQSTRETLLGQGYPPAFAEGFQDGCQSGQQAAGAISGGYRKNVPLYLSSAQYAEGWGDGFQQCQAMVESRERRAYHERRHEEQGEHWQEPRPR